MTVSTVVVRGDARHLPLADESVHCVVTSPPYFGLRNYEVPGQLGLEPTPDAYVASLVAVFREVWRVLRPDGTVWLNLGDSYAGSMKGMGADGRAYAEEKQATNRGSVGICAGRPPAPAIGLKPKDLIGIPWRVALALQAEGWYLRSDIVWCLSGGTVVYARTQKGDMPMTVKDLARLDPSTVRLWNGEKWTRLLGMSRNDRCGDELEIVLRSGERISCTPTHRFPTRRGLLDAGELRVGDVLQRCRLPEPESVMDCAIDEDAAWLAGLYIAEGSRADDTIQIAGHVRETERWERIRRIAAKYGGWATKTEDGNNLSIRVYGKVLCAILDELVTGRTAKDKGFGPHVWRYSNAFLGAMLDGYLSGDGHWDAKNNRWRLGFTRNYNLERDLRTACARLDYRLTLNLSSTPYKGKAVQTFRGEIRKERNGHPSERAMGEVVAIRKARCRQVYDIGVADDPHLFALASGVLTHNSKPNPMPESVRDRPTKSHEYLFLLAKGQHYYYDAEAIKEPCTSGPSDRRKMLDGQERIGGKHKALVDPLSKASALTNIGRKRAVGSPSRRSKRDVWTLSTGSYRGAHFATMPPALVEPCVLAGSSERGCCPACGAPWERVVERVGMARNEAREHSTTKQRMGKSPAPEPAATELPAAMESPAAMELPTAGQPACAFTLTIGWRPTCECEAGEPAPCVVLDPFGGSGTTAMVAGRLGRLGVVVELNRNYCRMASERLAADVAKQPRHVSTTLSLPMLYGPGGLVAD